jgi:hypothetical protein
MTKNGQTEFDRVPTLDKINDIFIQQLEFFLFSIHTHIFFSFCISDFIFGYEYPFFDLAYKGWSSESRTERSEIKIVLAYDFVCSCSINKLYQMSFL